MRLICPTCAKLQAGAVCADDGTPLEPASDDPLLGLPVGSWRIVSAIGAGGMGRVYRAVQPVIGARVAVKVLAESCASDRELVERFIGEARAVNLIRHEHIVQVLDGALLPDGRPLVVEAHLDGAPLSASIAEAASQARRLPVGGVARLLAEVLSALTACHAKGIVHRDLKPDNVFVTPAGHAKVLDFGIAKLAPGVGAQRSTRLGTLLGTPSYMSPEQAAGRPVDARADLYAMGVILFEAATGALPFPGSGAEVLRAHVADAPPLLRSVRPELPAALEAVVARALEKDPARRFQSAAELGSALAEAAKELPAEEQGVVAPVRRPTPAVPVAAAPRPEPVLPDTKRERGGADPKQVTREVGPSAVVGGAAPAKARAESVDVFAIVNMVLGALAFVGAAGGVALYFEELFVAPPDPSLVGLTHGLAAVPFGIGALVFTSGVGLWRRARWAYVAHLAGAVLVGLTGVGIPYAVPAVWLAVTPRFRGEFSGR